MEGTLILTGPFNIIIKMTKNKLKKFCLALDLKDDKKKINAYKLHHKNVWPEIKKSIKESGIKKMEIFLTGNRLFMIIKVDEFFSFEKKEKLDSNNPRVREWENLMGKFQKSLPFSDQGSKWVLMEKIFDLK